MPSCMTCSRKAFVPILSELSCTVASLACVKNLPMSSAGGCPPDEAVAAWFLGSVKKLLANALAFAKNVSKAGLAVAVLPKAWALAALAWSKIDSTSVAWDAPSMLEKPLMASSEADPKIFCWVLSSKYENPFLRSPPNIDSIINVGRPKM
jgi:hypothetical protein